MSGATHRFTGALHRLAFALKRLELVRDIIEDCRSGLCPVELDDAPAPLEQAIAVLRELATEQDFEPASIHINKGLDENELTAAILDYARAFDREDES